MIPGTETNSSINSEFSFLEINPLLLEKLMAKHASTANCAVNAFVEATPISGPALIGKTNSDSLAIELSTTFTIEIVLLTLPLTFLKAANVSAVSPD